MQFVIGVYRKMRRMICLILTLCLLAACGLAGAESRVLEGKPWINSDVLGNLPDEKPAVEESLDLYANYDAYREGRDKGNVATLAAPEEIDGIAGGQILDLCRSTAAEYTEDEILRILYSLMTDTENRNTDGLAPLMAKVDRVKAAETTDDLLALLQENGFMPCDSIFDLLFVMARDGSNRVMILTDKKILLEDKPHVAEVGKYYEPEKDTETPKAILMRMQYSEEEAADLAERMKEYDNYYPDGFTGWPEGNILTIEQLKEKSPLAYAQAVGMGMVKEGTVYEVSTPENIETVNHFLSAENLDLLKAIIVLSMYRFSADYLDEATWKTEGSWRENESPDQNLYSILNSMALIAMDQAYLKHFCPEEKQEMAVAMLGEIKVAMRNRIEQSTWLDEGTKKRALEKLELITVAPFTAMGGMFDCESLKTSLQSCTTLLDAAAACERFHRQCLLRYVGEPYVRGSRYLPDGQAFMSGNGVYDPVHNMIWIGGPALVMPCFDTKSKETMLGTLGQHLAHELSHAFDADQALIGPNGMEPLFSEESLKTFTEKVNAMIGEMNKIEPFEGEMLNGRAKVAELLADVTGVSLVLDVAKKTEDFDYAEFFLSYAGYFRTCKPDRDALAAHSRSNHMHPMSYIRINYTAAQFEEFYEAFPSVTEGTPMYIAPENRVLIW